MKEAVHGCADTCMVVLRKFCSDHQLNMDKLVAFGSDGAAVMIDKITHDHTYSLPSGEEEMEMTSELAEPSELETDVLHCTTSDNLKAVCAEIKSTLHVSLVERERIERDTRKQCSQHEWHILRSKRKTGSKCGRILSKEKKHFSFDAVFEPQAIRCTTSTYCLGTSV